MVNKQQFRLIFICCLFQLQSCTTSTLSVDVVPFLSNSNIEIDGELDDWKLMQRYFEVKEFKSPWRDIDSDQTNFKAVVDDKWFYFSFKVVDTTMITIPFTTELDVAKGDRVEFFIAGDSLLRNYYCLEVNPNGDILDYQASHYRKFKESWNYTNLKIQSKLTKDGYQIEGQLPIAYLQKIGKRQSNGEYLIWLGLYRADFEKIHDQPDPVVWFTWIDPEVKEPDFHIPSSFKKVLIKQY